jgi:ATP-binding cassette, subfamily F, member 3
MSLIRIDKVFKSFDTSPILEGVAFRVEEGEKIGLIGRNGTGKSTLFRLIMGDIDPDAGSIERMRRARFACLSQLPTIAASETIFDAVMASFSDLIEQEHELSRLEERLASGDDAAMARYSELQEAFQHGGGYEFRLTAKRVLHGLGFTEKEFGLHVNALSGGQRTRLMLALVLLQDADLLLLDEPENHLDLEAREWLEGFLKESRKAFVVISHDRQTLNAVVDRIVELEHGRLQSFTGNYDAYLGAKTLLRDQQQKAFDRQQEFIEKEEKWIDRFRYKNTKASQVQSRIKRLEKLERVEAPLSGAKMAAFGFGEVVRSGQLVLEGSALGKSFGELKLYDEVSVQVERGERVGIIGPNGCGKTTLLRQLAGVLEDAVGEIRIGHKVCLGFYDQHHANLNPANDVFKELGAARPDWLPGQVRTFLGRFLFTGEDVFKPIPALSGGELSRVAIAKLISSDANLLLLDEPTNHLDLASREALESALEQFPGTLIMVSHDRALVDRLAQKLVIFKDGQVSTHLGNYSHYRWRMAERDEAEEGNATTSDPLKIRRRERAKSRQEKQRDERKHRKNIEELEGQIEGVEETINDLEAKFTEIDPNDYGKQQELKQEYDALKVDLGELYSAWEEAVQAPE